MLNPIQLMNMLQNSNNPMAMLSQVMGNNPQFSQAMGMLQNKTPQQMEQYVRNMYANQGIDINQVANQFGLRL